MLLLRWLLLLLAVPVPAAEHRARVDDHFADDAAPMGAPAHSTACADDGQIEEAQSQVEAEGDVGIKARV